MLHALITGQARDTQGVENALSAASAAQGIVVDDTTRTMLIGLFEQLRGLDYGPYARGYRIEQPAPDYVRVAVSGDN